MRAALTFPDVRASYTWVGVIGLGLGLGLIYLLVSPLAALATLVGVAFCGLALWKPMTICYTFILATVLASGIPRGSIVPLLIPHEAFLLVGIGLSLPALTFRRRKLVFPTSIVAATAILVVGTMILPVISYLARRVQLSTADMFSLLAPLKYVLVFWLFSTVPETDEERQRLVQVMLIGCSIVAFVGLLQAFRVQVVIATLERFYPSSHLTDAQSVGRVTSLLRAWNALGTFLMANLLLITSIQGLKTRRFYSLNRVVAVLLGTVCLLASGSYAALLGLGLGILLITLLDQRGVRRIVVLAIGFAVAVLVLQPLISERFQYQFGKGELVPATLAYRFFVWSNVYWPIIRENLLVGVSPTLTGVSWQWAESQYLFLLFRSGLISLVAHLAWVVTLLIWLYGKIRASTDFVRALAVATFVLVAVLTTIGLTNEVFTLSGVVEYLWIMLALVVGSQDRSAEQQQSSLSYGTTKTK